MKAHRPLLPLFETGPIVYSTHVLYLENKQEDKHTDFVPKQCKYIPTDQSHAKCSTATGRECTVGDEQSHQRKCARIRNEGKSSTGVEEKNLLES